MAATAINLKLQEYGTRLADHSQDVREFEIRGIMRDLDSMAGHDHGLDGWLFNLRAMCYLRLSRPAQAAEQLRLGLQRFRDASEVRSVLLCNQSAAFLLLGRTKEAAQSAIEAARAPHPGRRATLANLAVALDRLGEHDMGSQVFDEAIEAADPTNAADMFAMAMTAADIGRDENAVEFFARFVALHEHRDRAGRSSIDVVATAGSEAMAACMRAPVLLRAVRRALAFEAEIARPLTLETAVEDEGANREAADVFDATKGLRSAAAVLALRDQHAPD